MGEKITLNYPAVLDALQIALKELEYIIKTSVVFRTSY